MQTQINTLNLIEGGGKIRPRIRNDSGHPSLTDGKMIPKRSMNSSSVDILIPFRNQSIFLNLSKGLSAVPLNHKQCRNTQCTIIISNKFIGRSLNKSGYKMFRADFL